MVWKVFHPLSSSIFPQGSLSLLSFPSLSLLKSTESGRKSNICSGRVGGGGGEA